MIHKFNELQVIKDFLFFTLKIEVFIYMLMISLTLLENTFKKLRFHDQNIYSFDQTVVNILRWIIKVKH